MKMIRYIVIIIIPVLLSCNRDPWSDYKNTIRSGRVVIPWVKFLDALVDAKDVDHFITHYNLDKRNPREWQTVVYFYDRYRMQIIQDVIIDYDKNVIKGTVGEMRIVINEVTDIEPDLTASYGEQVRCGIADWEKFVKSKGDFAVFPMKIIKGRPIPLYDKYRAGWGKDIIK